MIQRHDDPPARRKSGVGRGVSRVVAPFAAVMLAAVGATAQAPPAAVPAPPSDAPSIRVGMTVFSDFTYNQSPMQKDAEGREFHFSQFNVSRSYINVTGSLSHLVAFRITPDITRETGAGSSLAGSLDVRIKYAYAQFNLDDWTTSGSWVRFGVQQTPWVDFQETIYRYRFQGTVFSEREGFLSSSDAGASFRYNLPSDFGDVHAGVYNGETYAKAELNDQKAFQVRGTVRPFARTRPALRGVRGHLFYDADHYAASAERKRLIGSVTFEHRYLNAGYEHLNAEDRPSAAPGAATREGRGWSIWATPKSPSGFEALLRYDRYTPNTLVEAQQRRRTILGLAYWFRHQGPVSTAILVDYDNATFPGTGERRQTRIAVHGLVAF